MTLFTSSGFFPLRDSKLFRIITYSSTCAGDVSPGQQAIQCNTWWRLGWLLSVNQACRSQHAMLVFLESGARSCLQFGYFVFGVEADPHPRLGVGRLLPGPPRPAVRPGPAPPRGAPAVVGLAPPLNTELPVRGGGEAALVPRCRPDLYNRGFFFHTWLLHLLRDIHCTDIDYQKAERHLCDKAWLGTSSFSLSESTQGSMLF